MNRFLLPSLSPPLVSLSLPLTSVCLLSCFSLSLSPSLVSVSFSLTSVSFFPCFCFSPLSSTSSCFSFSVPLLYFLLFLFLSPSHLLFLFLCPSPIFPLVSFSLPLSSLVSLSLPLSYISSCFFFSPPLICVLPLLFVFQNNVLL